MKLSFKHILIFLSVCCFFPWNNASGQISYGGRPLLAEDNLLRSAKSIARIAMPAIDIDSLLRAEEQEEDDWQRTYTFAHKFYTHIDIKKEVSPVVLSDGMRVWQLLIHSADALSVNLLFTRYHLPEGAQLFIYSNDCNQVIGKFDHRNNSSLGILPVRPVVGESIIVEYAEPSGSDFEGEVIIGEVNHGYKDFLNGLRAVFEPGVDIPGFSCMPDALCEGDVDETIVRSTILLVVEGKYLCTGTMVNNTAEDETPYVLTANHCMNPTLSFPKQPEYYIDKAGTIIAFFNYHRTVCGNTMKAAEEMSMAVAHPRIIIEKKDIALLEFEEKPPVHYNVYYAGWDMQGQTDQSPYTNLHHPNGALKKYGQFDQNLLLTDYVPSPSYLDTNAFWEVSGWTIGSTHLGSSGSPLFNNENQIIGVLTGGASACTGTRPNGKYDYFPALYKSWNTLSPYLDPLGIGTLANTGFDPHADNSLYRIANADYNNGDAMIASELSNPNKGFVFGNSNLPVYEFAEEFNLDAPAELQGVYLFIPKMPFSYTQGVEIEVYNGNSYPETLLASTTFIPQFMVYGSGDFIWNDKNTNIVPTESFVSFDKPFRVDKKFFVVYRVTPSETNRFAVYNTQFTSSSKKNTAWVKSDGQGWTEATYYTPYRGKTSLAIQALVRYKSEVKIEEIKNSRHNVGFRYNRTSRTISLDTEIIGKAEMLMVYSVTGQLLEKINLFGTEEHILLKEQPAGTVGIVKIKSRDSIGAGKIVY